MTPEFGILKSKFVDVIHSNESTEVKVLAGELSTRKYYRISVTKPHGSEQETLQRQTPSYVLQAAEAFDDPQHHPFLIAQQIFASFGIRVPKIFGVSGQEGWILVEDCGDFFLQFAQTHSLYREALTMLYLLQRNKGQKDDRLTDELKVAPHWSWSFDFEKFNAEMLHTEKFFAAGLLKDDIRIASLTRYNSEFLSQRPRVLCHRDFHSRNLLVRDGHLFALDFQDARMGPVSYDLVSLLWDPYAHLKNDFIQQLLAEWKAQTDERFLDGIDEEIERMKIQRLLKAIGSYSSFYLDRGNPSCFVYVEAALLGAIQGLEWLGENSLIQNDEKKLLKWLNKQLVLIADKCA
jgi:hypothetical protein